MDNCYRWAKRIIPTLDWFLLHAGIVLYDGQRQVFVWASYKLLLKHVGAAASQKRIAGLECVCNGCLKIIHNKECPSPGETEMTCFCFYKCKALPVNLQAAASPGDHARANFNGDFLHTNIELGLPPKK